MYYGARYYDPRTSVWQSADPILDSYLNGKPNAGVFNPFNLSSYTYTYQNPVKYVDPSGNFPFPFIIREDIIEHHNDPANLRKNDPEEDRRYAKASFEVVTFFIPMDVAVDAYIDISDGKYLKAVKDIGFAAVTLGKGKKIVKGYKFAIKLTKRANNSRNVLKLLSKYAAYKGNLPKKLWKVSTYKQNKHMTKQLGNYLKKNPKMKSKFTKEQLGAIKAGKDKIPGYTWHHGKKSGRMELVPRAIHRKHGHTGGQKLWGGKKR